MTTTERQSTHRLRALGGVLALTVLATACGGSSSPSGTSSSTAATSSTTVGAGPTAAQTALVAARPFDVHVPPGHVAATPAPLLILLHGYGASGAIQEAYLKLTPATDAHGMLYVHLDGTLNAQSRRFWNATDACCGYRSRVDDSAYITAVIADVKTRYEVDPRRVFIVGHSNGGFMAYRMACDHSDEIAAVVSIEGATWANPSRCKPTEAVATLEVHGTADQTINDNGGTINRARYPGAMTTVRTWARADGCDLNADRPALPPHAIEEQLPPATVLSYSTHCDGSGHAELWTQPGGGHIPVFSPTFADQVVTFLLAHPKR
jgi:Poly(3-hydroxybutyrate) depolymerase